MNTNPNDPVVTFREAAARMGVNQRRARNILTRNLIQPVHTQRGIGVRLADVEAVKRMSR